MKKEWIKKIDKILELNEGNFPPDVEKEILELREMISSTRDKDLLKSIVYQLLKLLEYTDWI